MTAKARMLTFAGCCAILFVDLGAAQRQNIQQIPAPVRAPILKRFTAKRMAQGPGPENAIPMRRAVNAVLGLGWEALPQAGSDEVRIESRLSAGPSSEKQGRLSVAAAWEQAHELRRTNAFSRVEPVFSGTMLAAQNPTPPLVECNPQWPDSETLPVTLPAAAKDSRWSLAATNVPEAWALFTPLNKEPGAGAVVAHPDTGFREHPAIHATDAAGNRKPSVDEGYDFILNQKKALDIAEEGALQWPGHGTRTGSVIVARRDYQLNPAATRAISGVAGGARLIPLRVASRVLLLDVIEADMDNLAAAIRAASIGDPNYVDARAHIISMSLGGAPSRAVRDALKVAAQQNVIVLAAAGNQVPTRAVVWPARYDGVLAIAASNADSKPWSGSSAGSKIVISAPGESVWVASRRFKEKAPHDCLVTGTGTSYAVATTAGIAALWVSFHADNPTFKALTNRGRTFAEILKRSFRPVNGWDTAKSRSWHR